MRAHRSAIEELKDAARRVGGATWTIATTFELGPASLIDVDLIEREELGLGEALVIVDAGSYPASAPDRPKGVRLVRTRAGCGVHGKVILMRGPAGVALWSASANLTHPGLAGGNLEIVNLTVNPEPELLAPAIDWLLRRLGDVPWTTGQWREFLLVLRRSLPEGRRGYEGPCWLDNDAVPMVVAMRRRMKGKRVKRITVMSPYLGAKALSRLGADFGVGRKQMTVVIPSNEHEDRRILKDDFERWRDRCRVLRQPLAKRFPHAKTFLFEFAGGAFLAAGSANATFNGLYRRAGRGELAECMIGRSLSVKKAAEFKASFPIERLSRQDRLDGDESFVERGEGDVPDLLAWYFPGPGTVELWPPEGKSLPPAAPVLVGKRLRMALTSEPAEALFSVKEASRGDLQARLERGQSVKVLWGGWSGELELCTMTPAPPPSLEALWGGAPDIGGDGTGRTPSGSAQPDAMGTDVPRASLDEYERRSLRVTQSLNDRLDARYGVISGDLALLWESDKSLGLSALAAQPDLLDGCVFFLGSRLLARFSGARKGRPDLAPILDRIEGDVSALKRRIFRRWPENNRRQLDRWLKAPMWLEHSRGPAS